MSSGKHTPEPWAVAGDLINGAAEPRPNPQVVPYPHSVAKMCWDFDGDSGANGDLPWSVAKANQERILACVNACAGIPTHALQRLGDGGMWDVLKSVLHQLCTDSDLDDKVSAPQKYDQLEKMVREAVGDV